MISFFFNFKSLFPHPPPQKKSTQIYWVQNMTFVYRKKLQIYSIFAEHIKVLYFLKVKPTNKHFLYVNITCLCLILNVYVFTAVSSCVVPSLVTCQHCQLWPLRRSARCFGETRKVEWKPWRIDQEGWGFGGREEVYPYFMFHTLYMHCVLYVGLQVTSWWP